MKPFYLLLILLGGFVTSVHSQILDISPSFPTVDDTITLIYNAKEGNGALRGISEEVYMHTGVITANSQSPNDWKYVVGQWGTKDARLLLESLGNDLYRVRFHIRSFYAIPGNEDVLKLAFVFRNANGSIVGRASDGSDIFYNVFKSNQNFNVELRSPSERYIISNQSDSISIVLSCNQEAEVELKIDQNSIDLIKTKEFNKKVGGLTKGFHEFILICKTATAQVEKKFYVFVEPISKLSSPNGPLVPGFTSLNDSLYRFVLMAPGKSFAMLSGDLNDYLPDDNFVMHLTPNLEYFWLDIPITNIAKSFTYQYWLEKGVKIGDPHSVVILDPVNDKGVPKEHMTNLPAYPLGKTTGIVTAAMVNQKPFQWKNTEAVIMADNQLMIYEVLLRDFSLSRNFKSLQDSLPYLKRIGINAIELMPVQEYEGNLSWGYNPSYHQALDKFYGSVDDFKSFVDAAHGMGMIVLLDVVYNHAFSQSPLAQLYWNSSSFKPDIRNPFLNPDARHPFNVGYDFNHESVFTRRFIKQVMAFWLDEYHVDGFRFDLSKGFTQVNSGSNVDSWGRYDPTRIAIWKDYGNFIWGRSPQAKLILEHFTDNEEEKELSEYGFLIWGNSNHTFNQATMGYENNSFSWAWSDARGLKKDKLISYMESHDEERLMYKNLQFGNTGLNYTVKNSETALERMKAAYAFYLFMPGPKMIWQFGEFGYDYSINHCINGAVNSNCRLDPKPLRWDYLAQPSRKSLYDFIGTFTNLKKHSSAFTIGRFEGKFGEGLAKFASWHTSDTSLLLACNFGIELKNISIEFPSKGNWYDYFSGELFVVNENQLSLPIEAGKFVLLTNKPWTFDGSEVMKPQPFLVAPNPFNEFIKFYNTERSMEWRLYDVQGKLIKTQTVNSSTEYVNINTSDVPHGLYFLHGIKNNKTIFKQKMVKSF